MYDGNTASDRALEKHMGENVRSTCLPNRVFSDVDFARLRLLDRNKCCRLDDNRTDAAHQVT